MMIYLPKIVSKLLFTGGYFPHQHHHQLESVATCCVTMKLTSTGSRETDWKRQMCCPLVATSTASGAQWNPTKPIAPKGPSCREPRPGNPLFFLVGGNPVREGNPVGETCLLVKNGLNKDMSHQKKEWIAGLGWFAMLEMPGTLVTPCHWSCDWNKTGRKAKTFKSKCAASLMSNSTSSKKILNI